MFHHCIRIATLGTVRSKHLHGYEHFSGRYLLYNTASSVNIPICRCIQNGASISNKNTNMCAFKAQTTLQQRQNLVEVSEPLIHDDGRREFLLH
jgi:hypothetical protein